MEFIEDNFHGSGKWVEAATMDSEAQFPYWQNGNHKMHITVLF